MNQELEKKLEKLGLTPEGALSKAKRKYRDAKVIRTYSNKIEKDEQRYFKDDEYLLNLVADMEMRTKEIEEYIDLVLTMARTNPQTPIETLQEEIQREIAARTVN
jgi:hypothetical protein